MGALEIFLLIAGAVIFVGSFLLPQSKETITEGTKELAKEEIKTLVSQEMDGVKGHIDDVVEEAVGYAVEKTERSLERLTNEKIMAVNEYSDTVLQEIHKNHEEVMFLYDMLNAKHVNLKNTVSEVNKTMKEAEEVKRENEAALRERPDIPETDVTENPDTREAAAENAEDIVKISDMQSGMDISFMQDQDGQGINSNEEILSLHKQGKSNVAIAKELGLGVGEVKLVIDLYKNM